MSDAFSVLFVLPRTYPSSDAAARDMRLLALGLRKWGAEVRIISVDKASLQDSPWKTDEDGFPLRQAAGAVQGKLNRISQQLRMPFQVASLMEAEIRSKRPDVVVTYGQSWHCLAPLTKACRRLGLPLASVVTEHWPFATDLVFISVDNWFFRKFIQKRLSGVLAISHWLVRDAEAVGTPVMRLPALGEMVPPPALSVPPALGFHLVYVGPLFRRDLPETLICGFERFLQGNPSARLTIVGKTTSTSTGRAVAALVAKSAALSHAVRITGWVSDDDLAGIMASASAFVILRDDDVMSQACFPFRLSGFLLTGKPVILSRVGEVTYLFQDRVNALLVRPGDAPDELSSALSALSSDPGLAERVGLAGRETAITEMGFESHSARAGDFLRGLALSSPR